MYVFQVELFCSLTCFQLMFRSVATQFKITLLQLNKNKANNVEFIHQVC